MSVHTYHQGMFRLQKTENSKLLREELMLWGSSSLDKSWDKNEDVEDPPPSSEKVNCVSRFQVTKFLFDQKLCKEYFLFLVQL